MTFLEHICFLFTVRGCLFHLLKASESSSGPLNSDALIKTNGQLGKHNINASRGKVSLSKSVYLGSGQFAKKLNIRFHKERTRYNQFFFCDCSTTLDVIGCVPCHGIYRSHFAPDLMFLSSYLRHVCQNILLGKHKKY